MVARRRKNIAKYDTKELRAALVAAPDALEKWITRAFDQHGQVYKNKMHARFGASLTEGRNPTSGGKGGKLATRTKALSGSIGYEITGKGKLDKLTLKFFIGNADTIKYAVTQEGKNGRATVIVGKPWLAVPLPAALTGTGRSRIERPGLVKGKPGWLLIKSRKGNLIIGKKDSSGNFEPWWVLKKRVKIPARLGFERLIRGPELRKDLIARVRVAIVKGLREAVRVG